MSLKNMAFGSSSKNLQYRSKEQEERIRNTPFTDDLIFNTVMQDKEIAKLFLERIIGLNVVDIVSIGNQVNLDSLEDSRGVRFDILLEGSDKIYNVEMQTTRNKNLPKRVRYYQGKADTEMLPKGADFIELKTTFIIFVCTFNPFKDRGANELIYRFENLCKLSDGSLLPLGDESYKIFINGKYDTDCIENDDTRAFIELIQDGLYTDTSSELTDKIINKMDNVKSSEEWRGQLMTWDDLKKELSQRYLEQGREEGKEEGREEGREEDREEVVCHMFKLGMKPEQISIVSNTPLETVMKIKAKYNL